MKIRVTTGRGYIWEGEVSSEVFNNWREEDIVLYDCECVSSMKPFRKDLQGKIHRLIVNPKTIQVIEDEIKN